MTIFFTKADPLQQHPCASKIEQLPEKKETLKTEIDNMAAIQSFN